MSPFDPSRRILVIGEAFIDYGVRERSFRLGGVFHAARALRAIGIPYTLVVAAPEYLHSDVYKYADILGAQNCWIAGRTVGAPALLLIYDEYETGASSNEELLRAARKNVWNEEVACASIDMFQPTDILLFPGNYPAERIVSAASARGARIHIDAQYDCDLASIARAAGGFVDTVVVSVPLQRSRGKSLDLLWEEIAVHARALLVKENRGGSRIYFGNGMQAEAPAFPTPHAHGVGVGDCFDCIWLAAHADESPELRLARASYYAGLYAHTRDFEQFYADAADALNADEAIVGLAGLRLPWEERAQKRIYVAAPDFPNVATDALDELADALTHHGFHPLRPIQEHGLYTEDLGQSGARELFQCDVDAILNSALLIAVPLTNDPGTFAELGFAHAKGIPTILWDHRLAPSNIFAAQTADVHCYTLSEVIDAAYAAIGRTAPARMTERND